MQNFTQIDAANKTANARWTARQTNQLLMTDAQKRALLGVTINQQDLQRITQRGALGAALSAGLPTSINWTNHNGRNYVTPVKDQGGCGSCVSFCCVATTEAMALIRANQTLDLAEADLHFCSSHGESCGGWWPSDALESLRTRGVTSEAKFPYNTAFTPAPGPHCIVAPDRDSYVVKVTEYQSFASTADRKAWLVNTGPVCAVFHVYDDFFAYGGGVYHHVSGGEAGYHCVEIVGYDDNGGFWICKNSWGIGWGEAGFFCIAYGECGIDDTSNDHDSGGNVLRFPAWGVQNVALPATQRWHDWEDLGGQISSSPTVSSWADNRLDCFARGLNSHMWHKYWNGAGWSGWEDLGGVITDAPAAVSWGPNRIDCFAPGQDHAMWHKWWDGARWNDWENLGGTITSGCAVSSWAANRLDCFARGENSAMWHKWWDGHAWNGWEDLGGQLQSSPAAVSWGNGRIDTFCVGNDNALWHKWFDGGWSGWESLGGSLTSAPTVASWSANRLDVFARGTDSQMWHKWWDGNAWSGWEALGGLIHYAPAAVSWGPNRIDCFGAGLNSAMWHKWWG
jgi:C1A family cysteine protease